MRKFLFVIAPLLALTTAGAQARSPTPEIRPFVGAYIPTGPQRELFKSAPTFGLQAALEVRPTFHLLGSFAWTPAQDKYGLDDNDVSIFAYDAGIEMGMRRAIGERWELKPFIGLGAGARSYEFRSDAMLDKTCLSGYGAAGTELQLGRTAMRLEARNNVFCYRSPFLGNESKTRSDVGLALGLAYHLR